ncbi:MAG: diphosphate--fructose-6-phosphate 1-phosphotransferase, partial [Spirochaetaceae bacterium]|nr:diphosphate--fructose-6-phosphate 1-phosphotransferase [Spirochaetaceae bacterium]
MKTVSALQKSRYEYQPKLPAVLADNKPENIVIDFGKPTSAIADQAELENLFKNTYGKPEALFKQGSNPDALKKIRVGITLSGGQAPGGHNVIAGLY